MTWYVYLKGQEFKFLTEDKPDEGWIKLGTVETDPWDEDTAPVLADLIKKAIDDGRLTVEQLVGKEATNVIKEDVQ